METQSVSPKELLEQLQMAAEETGRLLIEAGQRLTLEGELPPSELAERLHKLESDLQQTLEAIEFAEKASGQPSNLLVLATLVETWENRYSLQREQMVWLGLAAGIASKQQADESVLAPFREQATAWLDVYQDGGALDEAQLGLAAPYVALVRLLQEHEVLTDEEWTEFEERVRSELPEAIVTAFSRNRLYLTETTESLAAAATTAASAVDTITTKPEKPEAKNSKRVKSESVVKEQVQSNGRSASATPLTPPVLPVSPLGISYAERLLGGDQPSTTSKPPRGQVKLTKKKSTTKVQASAPEVSDQSAPEASDDAAAKDTQPVSQTEIELAEAEAAPAVAEAELEVVVAEEEQASPSASSSEVDEEAEATPDQANAWVSDTELEPLTSLEQTAEAPAAVADAALPPVRLEESEATELQDLLWQWIEDNRLAYAYRLAEHLQPLQTVGLAERMLPELIQSALLALNVRHNTSGMMYMMKETFEKWIVEGLPDCEEDETTCNLLAAATLRPTILAPNTNALQVLEQLHFSGELYKFVQVVKEFGSNYIPLELNVLRNLKTESGWKSELKELQQRTQTFIRDSSNPRILFQPASKVWKKWMEPSGWVRSMLHIVETHGTGRLEELKEFVELYADPSEFRRRVDYTDRVEIGRVAGNDITARALIQLQSHMTEALELAREWINLVETEPGNNNEYHLQKAKGLQDALHKHYDAVITELAGQEKASATKPVRASVVLLRRAIENVYSIFDPNAPISSKEADPNYVLNAELLYIPGVGLQHNWALYEEHFPIAELLQTQREGWPSFKDVFESRLERQDIEGCQLMLAIAKQQEQVLQGAKLEDWEQLVHIRLKECRDALSVNIKDAMKRVELDFTHNLISDNERAVYLSELESMTRQMEETYYFPEKIDRLNAMRETLDQERVKGAERTRQLFREAGVTEEHPEYDRIRKVLDAGDLYTANEFLSRIQNNESLDVEDHDREPFLEFFDRGDSKLFGELNDCLEQMHLPKIIQTLKKGRNVGPLLTSQVPGAQRNQAVEMLEAWFSAKRSAGQSVVDERHVRTILNNIGLFVRTVTRHNAANKSRDYQIIQTEVLNDQNRCPVPHFGSEAQGQYRLCAFWDRLTEEDILHEIGDTGHGQPPVIVFYFGRLTAMKRRDLARLSKERRRTCIILDEILILYLCGERGSRLPVFFKCGLPFTYLEPYTTTASLIPTEMFYGRKAELQSIMEGRSGLVYGGRQLGKTALLREAERRFHAPEEGRYAVWIDLKAEGVGYNKSPNEVWSVIAKELNRVGVQDIKPGSTQPDKLMNQILDWLDKDRSRRILLLLDESDRFLEMDANEYGAVSDEVGKNRAGFIRCAKIKGLMERTNKRFHVVFAGLHNVQRSFKNQNDPLAHLGRAICVGPLFSNQEWKEARDLIQKPLAALGYFFESPDLIIRILSQTNYYPSLIQLYCHQLLRHMTEHRALASFSTKQTPPYWITSKHVDEAYQDRELQQAIKHRFQLTLQLDPRYEFIAHVIAHESLTDEESARVGIPVKDIRSKAMEFWSEGFVSTATDSFRVLLDEMVDLGVLRRVKEGYYTLRSPNLLSLMGSLSEIEEELLREDRELQAEYDASHFRPAYHFNGVEDISLRSPLTAEQESELRRSAHHISIIFGHRGAGIGDVEKFLEIIYTTDRTHLYPLKGVIGFSSFIRSVQEIAGQCEEQDAMILVDTDCTWTMEWVLEAKRLLASSKRYEQLRITFLADAEQTFTMVGSSENVVEEIISEGIVMLQLKPWHDVTLGLWLSDCELEQNRQMIDLIAAATGNWPNLLRRLYHKAKQHPHQLKQHVQELRQGLAGPGLRDEVLDELGLARDEVKTVLKALSLAEAKPDDLADFCELPVHHVRSVLTSAELLGTVHHLGKDVWAVDPAAGMLVQAIGDDEA